jgi:hypothetical protein
MDKREIVARAIARIDGSALENCAGSTRNKYGRMADAAIAALEPVTVQDEDKLIAAIWAHYGDLKSAKAALRALIEKDNKYASKTASMD